MSLQNEHTLHPISALDFIRDKDGSLLVLAGEGPYLKVFEAETSRLVRQCQIFEGQTIHGIAIQPDISSEKSVQVVVWGASSILMLTGADVGHLLRSGTLPPGSPTTLSDWILDAAISPHDDGSCVLITAHNTVLRVILGENNRVSQEELHSPSRSILYSAHLVWESPSEILVAAGTVFGKIIAWKCSIPDPSTQSKGEVLFTFTGHEGSIFGVNISPPIIGPHGNSRLLASCSDDRTIRLWDLSPFARSNSSQEGASSRETGFGNDNENIENRCLAVAMGHASRIWRVKFLVDDTQIPNLIDILSFGEDSTTQQWAFYFKSDFQNPGSKKTDSPIPGRLSHQKTYAFHNGKHISSAAMVNGDDGQILLGTGGADGKISFYSIQISGHAILDSSTEKREEINAKEPAKRGLLSSSWDAEEVLCLFPQTEPSHAAEITPNVAVEVILESPDGNPKIVPTKKKKPKKAAKDSFSRYAFTSENQVVVTTTFGRVLVAEVDGIITWTELFLPSSGKDDLKSWSVVKSPPQSDVFYLAGTNGKIYSSGGGSPLLEVGSVNGKVADMFVVSDSTTAHSELLVTTLASSLMSSFTIEKTGFGPLFTEHCFYELPEGFVVTSAGISGGFLILGSRYGSLAIYNRKSQLILLEDSHDSLNGDAITSIIPMPCQNDRNYFLLSGRKGAYSIFAFTIVNSSSQYPTITDLSLIHQGSPPFGPMIENAWFCPTTQDLILYGFKSKNFIVWNETRQYEISSVECGGAHRSYAYSPAKNGEGGHFVYTKAARLYLHSQPSHSHRIIKSGGHGREIKSCAVSEDKSLFATGAEDTAIRIWSYDESKPDTRSFLCLAVVQRHTAGIQHLQWYKSQYLFSSGGSEEFFIWAVEKLPTSGRIGIMCEADRPDQSEDQDLRIMSFDVTALPSSISDGIMNETAVLISLAYSDSTIRTHTYSKSTGYALVAKGRYTSSCLLQIKHLTVVAKDNFTMLTAGTDGNVTLWSTGSSLSGTESASTEGSTNAPQELVQLSTHKIHQSSIKTLDISTTRYKSCNRSQFVIATGGDDNALAVSILQLSSTNKTSVSSPNLSTTKTTNLKTFILRSAHAAAITGLSFLPSNSPSNSTSTSQSLNAKSSYHTENAEKDEEIFTIVTGSNDQRVKEWIVTLTHQTNQTSGINGDSEVSVKIKKVGDGFTPVADVGDVAFLKGGDDADTEGKGKGKGKKVLIVGNGMEVWRVGGS